MPSFIPKGLFVQSEEKISHYSGNFFPSQESQITRGEE